MGGIAMTGQHPIFVKIIDTDTHIILNFVTNKLRLVKNTHVLKEWEFEPDTKVSTLAEQIKQFSKL